MSVILTAVKSGRKKPKSAKTKQQRSRSNAARAMVNNRQEGVVAPPVPPFSNDQHTVWYWELDGEPMTVVYNKDTNQVWCNGVCPDTVESVEGDYNFARTAINFDLYSRLTGSIHQGTMRRRWGKTDQLYVNDCLIVEHADRPSSDGLDRDACCLIWPPYAPAYEHEQGLPSYEQGLPSYEQGLPSYEEAMSLPLGLLQLGENKKNK